MKINKNIVASAKVFIAFFIHLRILKIKDVKNVRKITKRRKTSFSLNRRRNI